MKADATALFPGSYTAILTLSSNRAANSPMTIAVTFTVGSPAPGATMPAITGIVNSASFAVGPQAGGTLFSIFGQNLAGSTTQATTMPLPTQLAGVSLTINSIPVPLLFVSPGQINAQVPYGIPVGSSQMALTTGGISYSAVPFEITNVSPGLFIIADGTGRGAIENQDYSVNSPQNPAAPGSTIMAYFTGEGSVSPAVTTGAPAPRSPLSTAVAASSATIGDQPAQISFTGVTPTLAGVAQMNITVPNLAPGSYPLVLTVGGMTTNAGQVAIRQ